MAGPTDEPADGLAIAVVVSRFPKFTETFVVSEIEAFGALGVPVEIHPLLPPEPGPHQPAAVPLVERAHYGALGGRPELVSFARTIGRRPRTMAGIVARLVGDTWRRPTFLLKDLVLLPRICRVAASVRAGGSTHVHAHFATHGGFAAWAIGRLTGLPYSIVAHGSDVHRHQAMLATKVAEAAFVATVSHFNRSVILDACGPDVADRVHVVRVGVDLSSIRSTALRPVPPVPTVVCVGTLHEVKGQRHLVDAIGLLAEQGREVRAELIGDGPDRDDLHQRIRRAGVDHLVELVGPLPHDAVLAHHREVDLIVTPSVPSRDGRREGLPAVIIEAMACGLPVVASDLAGISELVEHERSGLLVPPGDAVALAEAIDRLLSDADLREQVRANALERVRAEFSVAETAGRMVELMRTGGRPTR